MKLTQSQTKYLVFIYKSFDYELKGGDLVAGFCFIMGNIEFKPQIIIKNVSARELQKIGEHQISNIIFHLGLTEIPTYWKTACSPEIIIEAGYLDKAQITFWQDLIVNGMGQFFYENKLSFIKPKFIVSAKKPQKAPLFSKKLKPRFLVSLGGGKDSLVTLELLKKDNEVATLTINANKAVEDLLALIGAPNVEIERQIDPLLLKLPELGFLNGHTPFSSIIAFMSVFAAILRDFSWIAISQERSSNEGNVKYLGKIVNHQYSKTFSFENKFRKYVKKYIAKNVIFFSFLRPLYELQIAKIFLKYPKYFSKFLSCNKPFTIASRAAGKAGWCCNCPKCLFTFSALYPFAGEAELIKIFGKNLYDDKNLLPTMLDLLGAGERKPFECVGTFTEVRAAFYLSLNKTADPRPYLLSYFEKNILPKYPKISQESNKILTSWNSQNNLPRALQKILKPAL